MVFKYGSWELYGDEGWYVNRRSLGCFSLQGSNVRAVYEYGMLCIIHSHWAVPDEVVDKEVFKKLLRRASNLSIEALALSAPSILRWWNSFLFTFTVDTKE